MSTTTKKIRKPDLSAQIDELRKWLEALNRRIEHLEATAFQLVDDEEVVIVVVPKH